MSQYVPSPVTTAEHAIADAPYFGGEFAAYLSTKAIKHVGDFVMSAADTGTYTDDVTTALDDSDGEDLQIALNNTLVSDEACVITVIGQSGSGDHPVCSGTATFTPAGYAFNDSFQFQIGYAVDVVPAIEGDTYTSVDSVSVDGGDKGVSFQIVSLPDLATDYKLVGCTTEKDFTTKSRKSTPIACGMNGSAFSKGGRSQVGTLTLNSKLRTFGDGLARFDGQRCTAMLVGLKEDSVIGDRIIFTSYWPNIKPRVPDGEAEAMLDAEGNYADALYFVAP